MSDDPRVCFATKILDLFDRASGITFSYDGRSVSFCTGRRRLEMNDEMLAPLFGAEANYTLWWRNGLLCLHVNLPPDKRPPSAPLPDIQIVFLNEYRVLTGELAEPIKDTDILAKMRDFKAAVMEEQGPNETRIFGDLPFDLVLGPKARAVLEELGQMIHRLPPTK